MSKPSQTEAVYFAKDYYPPELALTAEVELEFLVSKLVGIINLLDATDLSAEDIPMVKRGVSLFDARIIPKSSQIMFGVATEVLNGQWVVGKAYRTTNLETILTHVAACNLVGELAIGEDTLHFPRTLGAGGTYFQRGRSSKRISFLIQEQVAESTKKPSATLISTLITTLAKAGFSVDKNPRNWFYDPVRKHIYYVDLILTTKGVEGEVRRLLSLIR